MDGYDASSSWSGYQYQGKVSIYIVLKYINEFGNRNEYERYSVEIENREDFSIKKDNVYISLHQVKAKLNSSTINSYLDAMKQLNKVKTEESKLYLHTAIDINNWDLTSYKETIENKIKYRKEEINKCEKNLRENIMKTENLNKIVSYEKQIDDLEKSYTDDVFNNVTLYEYDEGKRYCTLDNIENLIEEEIKRYFENNGDEYKINKNSIEIIYYNFLGFIDEHIKKRHQKTTELTIKFKSFKEKLDDEKIFNRGEQFHLFKIKDKYISRAIHDYCLKYCLKKDCLLETSTCEISKFISEIESLTLKDFKIIIHKLNPHITINNGEWENCEDFMNTEGIYFLYHMIINEISIDLEINNTSLYYKNKDFYYIPTTIKHIGGVLKNASVENYCINICNNKYLLESISEVDFLITENIDKENIIENITDVEEIDIDKKEEIIQMEGKEYLTNKIGFKSLKLVKEEFKL